MKTKCFVCENTIDSSFGRKYCSLKCKSLNARWRREARVCACCSSSFYPTNQTQKFCSRSCGLSSVSVISGVVCLLCGVIVTHKGRGWRDYCSKCRKVRDRQKSHASQVKSGKIKSPFVGSGGVQRGELNHQWLGGVKRTYASGYKKNSTEMWGCSCVVCGKSDDINYHHIDGDIKNPIPTNVVPLCVKHHKIVHKRRRLTTEERWAVLESIWPDCRRKIAEKTGNSRGGQPEVKAKASRND